MSETEKDPGAPLPLSPPLTALVASIEAARTSVNTQLDCVLAQVHAIAYMSGAIANAQRQRTAPERPAMPATFGARPSPSFDSSTFSGEPSHESSADISRAVDRAIGKL